MSTGLCRKYTIAQSIGFFRILFARSLVYNYVCVFVNSKMCIALVYLTYVSMSTGLCRKYTIAQSIGFFRILFARSLAILHVFLSILNFLSPWSSRSF